MKFLLTLLIIVAIVLLFNFVINLLKKRNPQGKVQKVSVAKILVSGVLLFYTIIMILLFIWAMSTSLKDQFEFRNNMIWFPKKVIFSNYGKVIAGFPIEVSLAAGGTEVVTIWRMYLNSILYSVGCAFMAAVVPMMVSYIVARFDFKPLGIIYATVILCMIIPTVGTLPAQYRLADVLHLTNSFIGAWIMSGHFLGLYFLVFYASFKSVPKDFTEAAKIDGAGNLMIMLRVITPLVRNMFFTIFLLQFIAFWNNYQTPLLFLPELPTISYGLFNFSQNNDVDKANDVTKIAACMFVFIPIFIVYLIFHNRLMGNLSMGGLKE